MSIFDKLNQIITPNGYGVGKLYSLKGNDVDWQRLSGATRINQNGLIESVVNNVPRLDYLNGGCPEILVEPQSTNKIIFSSEISNSYYLKDNISAILTDDLSPDGVNNSYALIENNANSFKRIRFDVSYGSMTHEISCFVKSKGRRYLFFRARDTNDNFRNITFDIENGILSGSQTSDYLPIVEEHVNGWFRIALIGSRQNSSSDIISIFLSDNPNPSGAYQYQGDGVSGVYLWGLDVKEGNSLTSHVPTNGSVATRSADAPQPIAVPSATTHIVEKLADGSLNVIDSNLPANYTIPFGRYQFIAFGKNLTAQEIQDLENYGV